MKFLADTMLGRLAKFLRMLGYDTVYYSGGDFREVRELARDQKRVLLTRNRKQIAVAGGQEIIFIREDRPLLQVKELLSQGMIALSEEAFFSRCLLCNTPLRRLAREEADGKVPEFVFYQQQEFHRCPHCKKIYWPGSHRDRMKRRLGKLQVNPSEGVG